MGGSMRVAENYLADLLNLDATAVGRHLHPRVHLRLLEPGSVLARIGASAVAAERVARLSGWDAVQLLGHSCWRSGRLLGLDVQLRLGRNGEQWECAERLLLDTDGGQIRRIDVLSTGCHLLGARTATATTPIATTEDHR